jgi:hypothetical protein
MSQPTSIAPSQVEQLTIDLKAAIERMKSEPLLDEDFAQVANSEIDIATEVVSIGLRVRL